jgi:hypothetical protein
MPEADEPAAGVSSNAVISAYAEVSEKAKRAAEIGSPRYHSFFITSSLSLTAVILQYFIQASPASNTPNGGIFLILQEIQSKVQRGLPASPWENP